jgi:chemotaxis protein CheZ
MAQPKPKKRFVAEILRARDEGEPDTSDAGNAAAAARHGETLAAIAEIKTFIAECLDQTGKTDQPSQADPQGGIDPQLIRREIESLRDAIVNTKREIAAVRHPSAPRDPLMAATNELDAVIEATEQATNTILQSAESVDDLAERIKQSSQDEFISRAADDVRELILKVFEACNFQDITGQRITKVVNTVKFIEERVNTMIAIWGKDSFAEIEVTEPPLADPDHALLSGPQSGENAVSQDDIDKLFG